MENPQLIDLPKVIEKLKEFARNDNLCNVSKEEERIWLPLLNQINVHVLKKDATMWNSFTNWLGKTAEAEERKITVTYQSQADAFHEQTKKIHEESKVAHDELIAKIAEAIATAKRTAAMMEGQQTSNSNKVQRTGEGGILLNETKVTGQQVVDPLSSATVKRGRGSDESSVESEEDTAKKQKPLTPSAEMVSKSNTNKPRNKTGAPVTGKLSGMTLELFVCDLLTVSFADLWDTGKKDATLTVLNADKDVPEVGKGLKELMGNLYIIALYTAFMQKLKANANTPFVALFNSDKPTIDKKIKDSLGSWETDFWMQHPRQDDDSWQLKMTPELLEKFKQWFGSNEGNQKTVRQTIVAMRFVYFLKGNLLTSSDKGYSAYAKQSHQLLGDETTTVFTYDNIETLRRTFSFNPKVLDAILVYLRTKMPKPEDGKVTVDWAKVNKSAVLSVVKNEFAMIFTNVLPAIMKNPPVTRAVVVDEVRQLAELVWDILITAKNQNIKFNVKVPGLKYRVDALQKKAKLEDPLLNNDQGVFQFLLPELKNNTGSKVDAIKSWFESISDAETPNATTIMDVIDAKAASVYGLPQ